MHFEKTSLQRKCGKEKSTEAERSSFIQQIFIHTYQVPDIIPYIGIIS